MNKAYRQSKIMSVQLIEDEEAFQKVLAKSGSSKLVVVEFFTAWCGACAKVGPYIDRLSSNFKESVIFLKINTDDCPGIAETFKIASLPTFVFIIGGQEVDRRIGGSDLETAVTQWASSKSRPTSSSNASNSNPLSILTKMLGTGRITATGYENQFKGQGNRLGGGGVSSANKENVNASDSIGEQQKEQGGWFSSITKWFPSSAPTAEKPKEVVAQEKMGVDQKLPHAPIQIRLVDSTKLQMLLNLHQSVAKIREFIVDVRPEFRNQPFILLASFPRKEIIDESISIEKAQLAHAVVIQKLSNL